MEKIKAKKPMNEAEAAVVTETGSGAAPSPAPAATGTGGLAYVPPRPADLPAYIDTSAGDRADGLENAGEAGLQLPLLLLAQPLTPQVVERKINAGDVVLNAELETPVMRAGEHLQFVPFYHFNEWIQWAPRDSGDGILARSKDPKGELARLAARQLQQMREGKKMGPDEARVTMYHVFFAFLDGRPTEPVAIPLSRTKFKKGQLLLSLALRRGPRVPLYAGKYSLTTVLEKNKAGQQYFNFDFKAAGWATEQEYALAKAAYGHVKEAFESTNLKYEPEGAVATEDDSPADAAASGGY